MIFLCFKPRIMQKEKKKKEREIKSDVQSRLRSTNHEIKKIPSDENQYMTNELVKMSTKNNQRKLRMTQGKKCSKAVM